MTADSLTDCGKIPSLQNPSIYFARILPQFLLGKGSPSPNYSLGPLSDFRVIIIHFRRAPLRVHSAECRHQSPEWTVLRQVNCVVHIEVAGFQILLNGFHPCNTRTSQWSPPVSCGGSC